MKKIFYHELDKILQDISVVQTSEREYLKGFFAQYKSGGITTFEVKRAMQAIKADSSDAIGHSEAEAVLQTLLEHLGED